jgi:4-hydroxymandelate oxidase
MTDQLTAAIDLERAPMRELERAAGAVLTENVFGYYSTGARDQRTLAENEAAWGAWWLRPRRLTGVSDVSTATTLLGRPVPHPIVVGPSAGHGMAHADAERGTAAAAAAHGGTLCLSTSTTVAIEEITAVPDLDVWFQLYPFEDRAFTDALVRRVAAAGVRAIALTVDVPTEADSHTLPIGGFKTPEGISWAMHDGAGHIIKRLDWDFARRLADTSGLPIILKGILHPEDAVRAADEGFPAVVVSNHGGRTLDGAIPSAMALPEIVAAAADRLEVYVDGGIRRGGDVLKALGLGARGVFVARPILWGLALGGAAGATTVLGRLIRELSEDLAFADVADVRAIPDGLVVPARPLPGQWVR